MLGVARDGGIDRRGKSQGRLRAETDTSMDDSEKPRNAQ
jgi:hypothetical protein